MMDGVCQKLVYFIIHPFIITLQSTKPNPVHQTLDPARRKRRTCRKGRMNSSSKRVFKRVIQSGALHPSPHSE